ncbi:MAG: hypothetical protein JXJ17_06045 [Anaerolineae bacterium]|nr:hypothetical protein [Anaerolineae bacterium]
MAINQQPNPIQRPDLRIRQMRIVWRDTFITSPALDPGYQAADFFDCCCRQIENLPCVVADTSTQPNQSLPPLLRIIDRVSRSVASAGHADLMRFQFSPLWLTNIRPALGRYHRPAQKLTRSQVTQASTEASKNRAWIGLTPVLLLHDSGVGIMEYYATINLPSMIPGETLTGDHAPATTDGGLDTEKTVEMVRLGIHTNLLSMSTEWKCLIPDQPTDHGFFQIVETDQDGLLVVAGLRDLSHALVSLLDANSADPPPRPTGSTTVVLVDTDPAPSYDLEPFVNEYAFELRGIGAMDKFYHERAKWIVHRELNDNFSTDAESGVYLLGNSELILFNDQLDEVIAGFKDHLNLLDDEHAVTYLYMHYGVLIEWIYLQEAILRAYLQRLDTLAATTPIRRPAMITTLHGALADLVQYQENISPYANRIEFLERARRYHQLDQLSERFERKQDLLLTYSSEYHDYREARAAEFLNFLVAILTGGELGNLIVNALGVTPDENVPLYVTVTLGSILAAFGVMILLRRSKDR